MINAELSLILLNWNMWCYCTAVLFLAGKHICKHTCIDINTYVHTHSCGTCVQINLLWLWWCVIAHVSWGSVHWWWYVIGVYRGWGLVLHKLWSWTDGKVVRNIGGSSWCTVTLKWNNASMRPKLLVINTQICEVYHLL